MSIRQRVIIATTATVGVVGAWVGLAIAQAPDDAPQSVDVVDDADILEAETLIAGVNKVRFYEPTDVVIYTHRGGADALTNDRALDQAVLDHARGERNDWLSPDGQYYADDLYLYAVDPEGRLVGTYFGENRAIERDAQREVQDATKDDLRAGRWTDAAILGVEEAAGRMNAPFVRSTGGAVTGGIASLLALAGFGTWAGVGMNRVGKSRRARAAGDRSMASVVAEHEVTEVHAKLIPAESRYGGRMLMRYDDYEKGFREMTDLGNRAKGLKERDWDSRSSLKLLEEYQAKAEEMDHLDDVIADTAALLNMDHTWRQAWERQIEPLRSDLEGVDDLLEDDLPQEMRGLSEGHDVRTFASRELTGLERLRKDLEERKVTPDDALDRLRDTRDELSRHLDLLAAAVARASSESQSDQELMEKKMRENARVTTSEPTIIDTSNPGWTWFTVDAFRTGYSEGTSAVSAANSSSSDSGSSSSYSGGGFSGSGSSSRF